MDARRLYQKYLQWLPFSDQRPFEGGEIIKNAMAGIVIAPAEAPDTIVKILHSYSIQRGLLPKDEFQQLARMQHLADDQFALPRPLSCGDDPHHVHMTRIGTAFGSYCECTPEEIAYVGRTTGHFAARLFAEFESVHVDLCGRNITRLADGRLGYIDIASIVRTRNPEYMFLEPLSYSNFQICPLMAAVFTKETGIKINLDRLEQRIEKSKSLPGIKAQQLKNLEAWRLRRKRHALERC